MEGIDDYKTRIVQFDQLIEREVHDLKAPLSVLIQEKLDFILSVLSKVVEQGSVSVLQSQSFFSVSAPVLASSSFLPAKARVV